MPFVPCKAETSLAMSGSFVPSENQAHLPSRLFHGTSLSFFFSPFLSFFLRLFLSVFSCIYLVRAKQATGGGKSEKVCWDAEDEKEMKRYNASRRVSSGESESERERKRKRGIASSQREAGSSLIESHFWFNWKKPLLYHDDIEKQFKSTHRSSIQVNMQVAQCEWEERKKKNLPLLRVNL